MKPLVICHRGYTKRYPENSFEAFNDAVESGFDGVELDVHMTKDGKIVVCHDEKIDRTSDGKGFIKDYTYSDLLEFDFSFDMEKRTKKIKIPLLNDVLELMNRENLFLNIELKQGPVIYEGLEKATVALLNEYKIKAKTVVSSFNHYSLDLIKKIDPSVKTGLLYYAAYFKPWKYARKIGAEYLHPYHFTVNEEMVKSCMLNGIWVNPFTVDEENDINRMIKSNVNAIITNKPDLVKKLINKRGNHES